MDDKFVSLQVHEGCMTRMERSNKRLFIALIVAVIILLINNIVWIGFENHRQDITDKVLYETETK